MHMLDTKSFLIQKMNKETDPTYRHYGKHPKNMMENTLKKKKSPYFFPLTGKHIAFFPESDLKVMLEGNSSSSLETCEILFP